MRIRKPYCAPGIAVYRENRGRSKYCPAFAGLFIFLQAPALSNSQFGRLYVRPGNLTPYFDAVSTILLTSGGYCGLGGITISGAGWLISMK